MKEARRERGRGAGLRASVAAGIAGGATAAVLVAGIFLGLRDGVHPAAEGRGGAAVASRADLHALEIALQEERSAREELGDELRFLRTMLGELGMAPAPAPAQEASRGPGTEAPPGAGPAEPQEDEPAPAFDAEALREAGVAAADAERLREAWEALQLGKLEVNDRAIREGWFFTPRHRRAHQALERELREELGEGLYDAFLYASGEPNRVVVREVLGDSAAARAGLRRGDVILRYDDARAFRPADLQLAVSSGTPGESVEVEVLRKGRTLRLAVPRGPLGVLMRPDSRPPGG